MFQFDADLSTQPAAQKVRAKLPATTAGWSLGLWFAEPTGQSSGQQPVDWLDSPHPAVMSAARSGLLGGPVRTHFGQSVEATVAA